MGWQRTLGTPPKSDERGFTLVELVVSMTILAIGIFGTMSVFVGSIAAVAGTDARTTAVAIATREVEGMRASAYATVGFSASAPGYVATVTEDGTTYSTVTIPTGASSTPEGADEVHKGVTFHIRRQILWMSTSYATNSWKRLVATITWTDKFGSHSVRQDAGVYPGGLGPANAPTTTTTTAAPNPSAPVGLTATVNGSNPYDHVDLAWSAGTIVPTYWEVGQSSDGGSTWITLSTTIPAGTLNYSASALSSGTTYQFRVRGLAGGAVSAYSTASAATQTPPPACVIGSGSISPNPDKKKNNNALTYDLVVTVNTSGSCSNLYVYFPVSTSGYLMTKTGTTYSYTLNKNAFTTWSTGNKTATIKNSSGTVLSSISFLIN